MDKLADGEEPPPDSLRKLREALKRIAAIKQQLRKSAEVEASEAVERFAKEDPDGARTFLERRLEDIAKPSPRAKGRPGTRYDR